MQRRVFSGNTPSRSVPPSPARSPIRAPKPRRSAMRMNSLAQLGVVTCALWLAPAVAFDGTRTDANSKPPVTPVEAFRSGAASLKAGENDKALSALQYAADQGYAVAQWKLGRMYAAGDGVPRDELRAFQYFSRIANTH